MKRLHAATVHANPRGGAADSSSSEGYPDDIEAEANSYFHQLFAEQLSMDAMIQMLARFSRSSDSRSVYKNFELIFLPQFTFTRNTLASCSMAAVFCLMFFDTCTRLFYRSGLGL